VYVAIIAPYTFVAIIMVQGVMVDGCSACRRVLRLLGSGVVEFVVLYLLGPLIAHALYEGRLNRLV
jgi:hypothetical protein